MRSLASGRCSSVSTVIRLPDEHPKHRSSIPGSYRSCVSSPKRPDRLGTPPCLLSNGWRRLLSCGAERPGRQADQSICSVSLRISEAMSSLLRVALAYTETALLLPIVIWKSRCFGKPYSRPGGWMTGVLVPQCGETSLLSLHLYE